MVGGVVAENVDAQSIKGVVSKWAALKWLNHQAALSPTPAKLVTGNQRYAIGDRVEIAVEGAKYPHLTLFNLPPDGRVEFFIPDPAKAAEATKDWSREGVHESFKVDKPPYGAEHMVAIFSKNDLADLHAALVLDDHGASGRRPCGRCSRRRFQAKRRRLGSGHLYRRGRLRWRLPGIAGGGETRRRAARLAAFPFMSRSVAGR